MKNKLDKKYSGAAALITVIIIGVAALIIGYNASFLAIEEVQVGFEYQEGKLSLVSAESCAEEALRRLSFDQTYTGGTLSLPVGSCIITVTNNPPYYDINIESTAQDYTRQLDINISLVVDTPQNNITINSWEEN